MTSDALTEHLNSGRNWEGIFRLALDQGLLNIIYRVLSTHHGQAVPEAVLERMRNFYFQNSSRNLFLSGSLIKILNLFSINDIEAVPFKGVVLSELAYNDVGIRRISDLDILIRTRDVVKARDLLIKNGFAMEVNIPNSQLPLYLRKENFFQFFNKSRTLNIDLHWELSGRYGQIPFYFPETGEELAPFDLLDKRIPVLSIENTLVHLCIHSASHCWENLESIFSIARIIESGKIRDWDAVCGKAEQLKAVKMLLLGLELTRQFFQTDAPIPRQYHKKYTVQKPLHYIVKKTTLNQKAFTEQLNWRFSPFHFQVRDSFPDKIVYFCRLFFQPTCKEWEVYPLPFRLLFLYYFLRPYRLIMEGLGKERRPD
jgi:hypothetical protein